MSETLNVVRRPEVPAGEAWISDQTPPFPVDIAGGWPTITIRFRPTQYVVAAIKKALEGLANDIEWKDPFADIEDAP